ncbi:cyclin-T1-4-like isoform X2 [Prosopis cineraria]|uniref:cyclin-T1-4-like isoform X2 n=1 Tax=Prosopis cineraria TaxID=364024 RepID=UPI00240EAA02|nr:cyclin-T1-4-like isoform X2 [Prosopis cineraria]
MSLAANFQEEGHALHGAYWSASTVNNCSNTNRKRSRNNYNNWNHGSYYDYWATCAEHSGNSNFFRADHVMYVKLNNSVQSSLKRRKHSASNWENCWRYYLPATVHDSISSTSASCKLECSTFEDEDLVFLSRDEIDRFSPSRKDGIDALYETNLRYSYCAFLQDLGMRLELPQTTIGTAMVLCHRFFVRRSHACHDRFLISTATLFLAAKSEDTPRPLNNVLQASSEILHKHNYTFSPYLPLDWFEQYRERMLEAETLILTTLNFELNVQHPYAPLTSILTKLGLSQTVLVNLALQLISEGVFTRLTCWPV